MYNLIDLDSPAFAIIYSLIIIVIGNFFLTNLILAVIMDTYVQIQERDAKHLMLEDQTVEIEVEENDLNEDEF